MKLSKSRSLSLAAAMAAFLCASAFADSPATGSKNSSQDQWLEKAKAEYPLDTCVVSGEKLKGDMGAPVEYVYKEAGKPDRLVLFCCKSCLKDFKKDPAKFLKKIDAAKAKPAPGQAGHS